MLRTLVEEFGGEVSGDMQDVDVLDARLDTQASHERLLVERPQKPSRLRRDV